MAFWRTDAQFWFALGFLYGAVIGGMWLATLIVWLV